MKEKHTPDGSGAANNYVYDASGNLTKDVQENINNIVWTADGKVDKICKDGCPKPDTIYFYYDARGDRIAKIDVFYNEDACSGTNRVATITKTFYVRDANGEILAIYKKIHLNRICTVSGSTCTCTTNDDELSGTNDIPLTEWLVYGLKGHGRFATVKPTHDTYNTFKTPVTSFARTMKFKEYELKDHLGDVRATFNDLKSGDINNGFYLGSIETFNYYPFGMLEPTTPSYSSYRFGYNGMERDDEVKSKRNIGGGIIPGKGNSYDYGARFYDPRGARWFSRDPSADLTPSLSPFVMASNNPIFRVDKDGRKDLPYHISDLSKELNKYDIPFFTKLEMIIDAILVDVAPGWADNEAYHFDGLSGFDQIFGNYQNLMIKFHQSNAAALSTRNQRMIFVAVLHAMQDLIHHSTYVDCYIKWYQMNYSLETIKLSQIPSWEETLYNPKYSSFKEFLKSTPDFYTGTYKPGVFGESDKENPKAHFNVSMDNEKNSIKGSMLIPIPGNTEIKYFRVTYGLSENSATNFVRGAFSLFDNIFEPGLYNPVESYESINNAGYPATEE